MGKYSGIIEQLPRFVDPDVTYQEKINNLKTVILNPPSGDLVPDAVRYKAVELKMQQATKLLDEVNQIFIDLNAGRRKAAIFARAYKELRAIKDAIDAEESKLSLTLESYSALVIDQYESDDISSLRLEEGGSVTVQDEPYAQVQDREQYRLWCIEQGLERQMSLSWQTTNALTKDRLIKGDAPPTGVKATFKSKLVLRKA